MTSPAAAGRVSYPLLLHLRAAPLLRLRSPASRPRIPPPPRHTPGLPCQQRLRHSSSAPSPGAPPGANSNTSSSSSSDSDSPIVLEQPTKFNPPSHRSASSGWRMPKMYGPKMTEAEAHDQRRKSYPGMMAPEGTWEHWFWHSRSIHFVLTIGTLVSLAIGTFILNFTHNSPFRDQVPELNAVFADPSYFFLAWRHAIRLHEEDRNRKVHEKRAREMEDAQRLRRYMRENGIEHRGIVGSFAKAFEPAVVEPRPGGRVEPGPGGRAAKADGRDSSESKA